MPVSRCPCSAALSVVVSPENAGGIGNTMWSRRQILWKYLEFFKVVSSYLANEQEEMRESIGEEEEILPRALLMYIKSWVSIGS